MGRFTLLLEAHEGEVWQLRKQNQELLAENQRLRRQLGEPLEVPQSHEDLQNVEDEPPVDATDSAGEPPCLLQMVGRCSAVLEPSSKGHPYRVLHLKSRWSADTARSKGAAAMVEEVYPASKRAMKQERSTLFRFSSRVMRQSLLLRPLHPNGRVRLTWDAVSLLFLSYDVFYVPFTALDPPRNQFTDIVDWSILIFWTLDIFLSNVTGFYHHGELVTSFRSISWQYLRTWFLLDLVVIVPDWFGQISVQSMEGDSVRVVRSLLRSLRCLRLLRLLKLQKLLAMVYDLIDSEMTFIAFTCARLVFGIFVLTHFIACAWYYLGTSMASMGPSWTSSETGGEAPVQQRDLLYRYTTAMHWSLTQFTPASMEITARNTSERAFSILVLFFSLLVFSSVIGQVTTSMMSLQNMKANAKKDFWRLRRFLRNRQVPAASRTRIIRYLEQQVYKDRGQVQQKDIKILAMLSDPLKNLLSWELHRRLLTKHRLLEVLQQCIEPMFVRLTSVVSVSALADQDVLFCAGEMADAMSFVVNGYFLYQPVQEAQLPRELSGGEWLAEACLWTDWHHLGTMSTVKAGELCHLEPDKFADVMQMHVWPWDLCQRYASEFLSLLNAQELSRRSDMFWHPKLQDEVHIKNLCETQPEDVELSHDARF